MRFSWIAFLAFSAPTAFADVVTYSVQLPPQPVPGTATVNLPAFDPDLGVLGLVRVTVSGAVDGSLGLENTNAQPMSLTYYVGARIDVVLPAGGIYSPNPAFEVYGQALSAYDGATDYGGSSGVTLPFTGATGTGVPSMTQDLYDMYAFGQAYVGPAGAPGTISIDLSSTEMHDGLPPGIVETHTLSASVLVRIEYEYDAPPASMCLATPWAPCPCNSAFGGYGCPNSVRPEGGRLISAGQASVSADTVVLYGSGMTNSLVIYFQGTGILYSSAPYGDGLRCIAGSLRRIGAESNMNGSSRYPGPGDVPISIRGAIPALGGTRYYQALYRDAAAFCLPQTLNATNGVMLHWIP